MAAVGTLLSTVGAHTARLQFESGCVVRDLRAGVNRKLNAETANLRRIASAAVQQLAAADALAADAGAWHALPPAMREAAVLRRRHPAHSLAQLARIAGCSRSAMAGRMHRLADAASPLTAVLV